MFLLLLIATPTALASLNDDRFDGNIFALYAGNGSLVPARVTLNESLKSSKPALLVFFLDDSKDCKQFSTVVSQLQAFYGRAASFIPVNVDAIIT
ncbi:MAG: thioredoxin family protein, partial [Okeania sp. SIO2D1]|nr:thioredoxin family protein [Okeania sp. SIO2D1]